MERFKYINISTLVDMNDKLKLKLFKALSEETRLLIVQELLKQERCACELPLLINRTQSNTSMHLSKLQDLGIIKSRKDGKMIIYSIDSKEVIQLMRFLR